jgi:hypothetical protein
MKYQVIVKHEGKIDKDTIILHDDDLDATISALQELENCADRLYEDVPEKELNEKLEKAKKDIKREFYAEFFGYRVYITLFALSQPWFVTGEQTRKSHQCQWPNSIILRVDYIALTNIAKYYAQFDYGRNPDPFVVPSTGIWLDDTETSLVDGKRKSGDSELKLDREGIHYRLYAQDDKDYWAEYRLVSFG